MANVNGAVMDDEKLDGIGLDVERHRDGESFYHDDKYIGEMIDGSWFPYRGRRRKQKASKQKGVAV